MNGTARSCLLALLVLVYGLGSGCSFFPEALQPQELWKLNRGPGYSQDPFFSVQDDIPGDTKRHDKSPLDDPR